MEVGGLEVGGVEVVETEVVETEVGGLEVVETKVGGVEVGGVEVGETEVGEVEVVTSGIINLKTASVSAFVNKSSSKMFLFGTFLGTEVVLGVFIWFGIVCPLTVSVNTSANKLLFFCEWQPFCVFETECVSWRSSGKFKSISNIFVKLIGVAK